MDLYSVYTEERHIVEYKWVALSNLSRNFSDVMGFLKFSIQVAHQSDKQITLSKEEISGDNEVKIILPPQIQMKGH